MAVINVNIRGIALTAAASFGLTACQTVKMPNMDFIKTLDDGFDEAAEIGKYPDYTDRPITPTDLRDAAEWDEDAKALIYKRDAYKAPAPIEATKSDAELEQELDALKARVKAYKLDDPQGGL